MALAALFEVKDGLGITGTDDDAQITALLEPVSALIEREAGRAFSSATVTERHAGGDATIALRRWPVASITTVTDKATGNVLASDQYELEGETGLLRRLSIGSQWASGRSRQIVYLREDVPVLRWEIIYVGGPATAPEDIKLALYKAIGASITGSGMAGLISEKDGDYSYVRSAMASAPGSLPPAAMAIVRSYRAGLFV